MSRRERIIIAGIGISLALSLILVALRWASLNFKLPFGRDDPNVVSLMRSPSDTESANGDQPILDPTEVPETSDLTPTQIQIPEGELSGEDIEDVLLLFSSTNRTKFDQSFCRIAEYYGLLCKMVDLDLVPLTEDVFKDEQGKYFKLIGIQAENLILSQFLVSSSERDLIKLVVEQSGATLLVSELTDENYPIALTSLTDGAVQGIKKPVDLSKDWIISSDAPEITREFTGQVFTRSTESSPHDFEILFGSQDSVTKLISSVNNLGEEYTLLASIDVGDGQIIIDASQESPIVGNIPLRNLFYNLEWFSRIIPVMMSVRYVMGDEAWHNDQNYANLTIDDIPLVKEIPTFDYAALLREMNSHNFHTTIGFVPGKWEKTELEVASLFRTNPGLFSIAQHGNNADGYEFYKYEVTPIDWMAGDLEPARPLEDQEADIVEGLNRLDMHWARYAIPHDKVMIFPGLPPETTLELLKEYNYLATVNGSDVPLDEDRPEDWDYGMYQANLDFGNFPMLTRRSVKGADSFEENLQTIIIDLFVDKPSLLYSSAANLFNGEMDAFSPIADEINALVGGVEWRSLGGIIEHLYLEKVNDDGSVDIKMYTNKLILKNETEETQDYHLFKEETLNIPISSVTVNGFDFPYLVWDGVLQIDLRIPAGISAEVQIQYEQGET